MASSSSTTKSIDVGSMFLMDLSVNDSDFNSDSLDASNIGNEHFDFPVYHDPLNKLSPIAAAYQYETNLRFSNNNHQNHLYSHRVTSFNNKSIEKKQNSATFNDDNYYDKYPYSDLVARDHLADIPDEGELEGEVGIEEEGDGDVGEQEDVRDDCSVSSLDRLASAIKDAGQARNRNDKFNYTGRFNNDKTQVKRSNYYVSQNSVTIQAKPQPPECKDPLSSPSFSDESFAASSGTSLSASFIASSSDADHEDRGSTSTREDSGVIDMKDLDNQLNNTYQGHSEESCDCYQDREQELQIHQQEKPISAKSKATNLINCNNSSNGTGSSNITTTTRTNTNSISRKDRIEKQQINYYKTPHYLMVNQKASGDRGVRYDDDGISNGKKVVKSQGQQYGQVQPNNNINSNNYVSGGAKQKLKNRSISASVPIEVPSRQMRKDLNKLKLSMLNNEPPTGGEQDVCEPGEQVNGKNLSIKSKSTTKKEQNLREVQQVDDVSDEFLDQEYNNNHQNHYPINEFDDEHLRAEENPMKLFASIQALAKSLHEDAELFGSLPPKRLLESPIRSLALV